MKLSRLSYFGDFLLFPPLVIVSTAIAFSGPTPAPMPLWAAVCLAAFATWTLVEYLVHRFVFHHAPVFSRIHMQHHESPQELIGTPSWISILLGIVVVMIPCWIVLGFDLATAVTAGMACGYLWYIGVHHSVHHFDLRSGGYFQRARLRHMLHHYRNHDGNFGVTTGFWDRVFGTALGRARGLGMRRAKLFSAAGGSEENPVEMQR